MKYVAFNRDKIRAAITASGMTDREFVNLYYGKAKGAQGMLEDILLPKMGAPKLMHICNLLGRRMDDFFDIEGAQEVAPNIQGNNNNINSTVYQTDNAALRSENKSLRDMLEEKDRRIADLQKSLDFAVSVAQYGRNSDTNSTKSTAL